MSTYKKALALAREHSAECFAANKKLFDQVYKHALRNSGFWSKSHVFGFFHRNITDNTVVNLDVNYNYDNPEQPFRRIARRLG